ncbi:MAG: glycosyltransferase family 39 protein [Anaerolineales bacterium]
MKEASVLDYIKSRLGLEISPRLPAPKRKSRGPTKKASSVSDVGRLIAKPAVLALAVLLTGYVLARLPRMPREADYSLVFVFWICSILAYFFAVAGLPKLRMPRIPRLRGEPIVVLVILMGITLAGLFLRIWNLETIPFVLSGDEASQGLEAVAVLAGRIRNPFSTGWYSVPTMNFFLFSFPIRLFGQTQFAVRLPAAILGAATIPLVFLLVRSLADKYMALAASLLVGTYHYHIHYSRLGANMIFDPMLAVLALFFLHRGIGRTNKLDWILAGLVSGLAFYLYAGARFVIILVVSILLYTAFTEGKSFFRKSLPGIGLMFGAFLVSAAPMLQYALRFPNDFNARINQIGIIQSGWLSREVEITGKAALQILLDQFRRAALAFNYYPDRTAWYGLREPLLDPVFGTLFIFGLAYATLKVLLPPRQPNLVYFVAWWWGAMLLGGMLTESPPSSQRLVTLAVPVCFFIVLAVWRLTKMVGPARLQQALTAVAVVAFAWISLGTYFVEYSPQRISGGSRAELATAIAPLLREYAPDHRIYFVGAPWMYWGFSTNPYLVPNADAVDITDPLTAPINLDVISPEKGAVFIILPERIEELQFVLATFPDAFVREIHSDSAWNMSVTLVIIPATL